jgi:hypothetical protein
MSDSIKKYHELLEEGKDMTATYNQVNTTTIVEIIRASDCAGNLKKLLQKAVEISKKGAHLTPALVFQIAGEEMKVDELCTPQKQKQWNNQD